MSKCKLFCLCLVLGGLWLWGAGPALAERYVEFTVHSRVGTLTQVSVAGIEGEPGAYVALTPQGERYPITQEGIEIEGVTYTIPRVQAPSQGGRTLEYAKLADDGEQANLSVDNVRAMVEVGSDWYQTEQDLCAAGAPPPLAAASCSQGGAPWSWQSYDKKLSVAGGELSLVFYVGYYTGPAAGYQPAYVVVRGADPSDHLDNLQVTVINAQFRLVGDLVVGLEGWNPRDLGILRFDPRLVGPGLLSPETIPAQANTSAYSLQDDGVLRQIGSSQEFNPWTPPGSDSPHAGHTYSTSDLAGTWDSSCVLTAAPAGAEGQIGSILTGWIVWNASGYMLDHSVRSSHCGDRSDTAGAVPVAVTAEGRFSWAYQMEWLPCGQSGSYWVATILGYAGSFLSPNTIVANGTEKSWYADYPDSRPPWYWGSIITYTKRQ